MHLMRSTLLCVGVLLVSATTFADDRAACLDAASQGQTLRDAHKLVEARDQFRVCARQQCPSAVQSDCTDWLAGVERNIPTVVLTAKDGAGALLADVTVTVDGASLTTKLDGRSLAVNPGKHTFHFELANGTSADEQVLVTEGTQNQTITATLTPQAKPSANPPTTAEAQSPLRTVGWVLGGVGLAGVLVGAVSGIVAISSKSSANCDVSNACDPGPLASAHTAATISDIGLIAGGALLVGGLAFVLFSPKSHADTAQAFQIVPALGPHDGALFLRGRF